MLTEKKLAALQKILDDDLEDVGDILGAAPELIKMARDGLKLARLESALDFLRQRSEEVSPIDDTLNMAAAAGWKYKSKRS